MKSAPALYPAIAAALLELDTKIPGLVQWHVLELAKLTIWQRAA